MEARTLARRWAYSERSKGRFGWSGGADMAMPSFGWNGVNQLWKVKPLPMRWARWYASPAMAVS
ncbi:hypothetical protein D3C71_2149150 [compost metagenome]